MTGCGEQGSMRLAEVFAGPDLDATDARVILRLQDDMPLVEHPFAALALELGLAEEELLDRLHRLLAQGVLTRLGPVFDIERAGGQSVWAAMAVPEARVAAVAACVGALPEVVAVQRRDHRLNLWFLLSAESAAAAQRLLDALQAQTGVPLMRWVCTQRYGADAPATTARCHGAD